MPRLSAILARVAILLILLLGALAMLQDRFLYLPMTATLEEVLARGREYRLVPWPDAAGYRGLLREPSSPARATVVLLHGNAGHAGHRQPYAEVFARLGLRVILAEYPGYGPRPGRPGEAALVADAMQTVRMAREQFAGPLLLAGESLGAGVAAAAAASGEITGLLLLTPWNRLENVARYHYPWAPVGWLLRDRYDSAAHLATFQGRIVVVLAARDAIVPPDLGRALYAALPEPKRLLSIPEADHNDWMARVDLNWWREVLDFLLPEEATAPNRSPGRNTGPADYRLPN
jgi:uncharacterized protein